MEPHAIPQDVTSFQFHLVGDMTLKQFIYLASGSTAAYILFITVASKYPLLAWPLITISAGLGAAFAFLPVGSRPLDYWLLAFLKAIYSPTTRTWSKDKKTYKETSLFNSRLVTYLSGLAPRLESQSAPAPAPSGAGPAPLPTTDELGKTVDLARQAQNLQLKIVQDERILNQIQYQASKAGSIPADYSGQVNKIILDLQNLIAQASSVRQKLDAVTHTATPLKPLAPIVPAILKEKVKVVTMAKPKQTQVALTTFPNVISGIIKDLQGNYLEGAITVIYDKEGLPMRALKSNKLGQFTGSTPLPNGTYKLLIEKDNYNFDVLQIELSGEILPPLAITSK